MKKRNLICTLMICMILMGAAVAMATGNKQVEQKAVISGTVVQTVVTGTAVKSGDSLIEISTLTGTTSAARATVDGTVGQVLVRQGDEVKPGQVVAYIEQQQ